MSRPSCNFYCEQILSGRLGVPILFENEQLLAFHHTNPIWEEHVVLLPKRHLESLLTLEEADNELFLELMRAARRIAADLMARHGGCRVYTNLGGLPDRQASPLAHRRRCAAPSLLSRHRLQLPAFFLCGRTRKG